MFRVIISINTIISIKHCEHIRSYWKYTTAFYIKKILKIESIPFILKSMRTQVGIIQCSFPLRKKYDLKRIFVLCLCELLHCLAFGKFQNILKNI